MTFELTPERLQEIAVGCVTKFMQKQASLNESIAKEAMDLELNPDQTKRIIEASNTLAYLRQLEKSADRTFEFEVADYNKVMATMCMPDDMLKSASEKDDKRVDEDLKRVEEDVERVKEDQSKDDKDDSKEDKKDSKDKDEDKDDDKESKDKDEDSDEEKHEKKAMLRKGYFQAMAQLEKMAYDEAGICMELIKAAAVVGKDPHGLEKLAHVLEAGELDKALKLCGIEKRAQADIIVTDKELADVKTLTGLWKEAQAFTVKKNELQDFAARAEDLLFKQAADTEKQAGVMGMIGGGILKGVQRVAQAAGSVIGGGISKTVSGLGNSIKGSRDFSRAAKGAGFGDTDSAVKAYDKIKGEHGPAAATARFKGAKPSLLGQRIGLTGAITATAGLGMDHKNNVKDI